MTDQQPPAPPSGQTPPPPAPPSAQAPSGSPYPSYPGAGSVPPGYPTAPSPTPGFQGKPSKAMAIIALVCAVLGFLVITWIAALVLAIIVLAQLRSGRTAGKGMAITALVLCALWAVALIALIVYAVSTQASRGDDGAIDKAGSLQIVDLRKGDCITDEADEDEITSVEVAPCSEPHLYEVYAVPKLPGDDFPGNAESMKLAREACQAAQSGFDATSPQDLTPSFIYPTKEFWDEKQAAICLVTSGSKVTGSFEDAA